MSSPRRRDPIPTDAAIACLLFERMHSRFLSRAVRLCIWFCAEPYCDLVEGGCTTTCKHHLQAVSPEVVCRPRDLPKPETSLPGPRLCKRPLLWCGLPGAKYRVSLTCVVRGMTRRVWRRLSNNRTFDEIWKSARLRKGFRELSCGSHLGFRVGSCLALRSWRMPWIPRPILGCLGGLLSFWGSGVKAYML